MQNLLSMPACLTALLLAVPAISPAQRIAIAEYPGLANNPYAITAGSDGALWFTETGYVNEIGRLAPAGVLTEYAMPNATFGQEPRAITAGPDGAVWFAQPCCWLGRITTGGVMTLYQILFVAPTYPFGVTAGPDGALWVTLEGALTSSTNQIMRSTTAGSMTAYDLPTPNNRGPAGITAGPDGALWFVEARANDIGRITTTGAVTVYPIPTAASVPEWITAGPDRALWFTETRGNNIGRITTTGAITEYPVPTLASQPGGITPGPDGALWFTEYASNQIGRITTAGTITEYLVPTPASSPQAITAGPYGLWFTEFNGRQIGQIIFVAARLNVSPPAGSFGTRLSFMGNGFAADDTVTIYTHGIGSRVLATATADSSGSFTATAAAPSSAYGRRLLLAVGQTSGKIAAAEFSAAPLLVLTKESGRPGSFTAAWGYGFAAGESVNIYWNNSQIFLGTATANINGAFWGSAALEIRVPPDAPPGINTVSATGQTTGHTATADFTVE